MVVCRAERDGFTGWLHQLGLQRFAPNCSERREAGVIKDHPSTMSGHCLCILQVCFRRLKIILHKLARREAEKAQQPLLVKKMHGKHCTSLKKHTDLHGLSAYLCLSMVHACLVWTLGAPLCSLPQAHELHQCESGQPAAGFREPSEARSVETCQAPAANDQETRPPEC